MWYFFLTPRDTSIYPLRSRAPTLIGSTVNNVFLKRKGKKWRPKSIQLVKSCGPGSSPLKQWSPYLPTVDVCACDQSTDGTFSASVLLPQSHLLPVRAWSRIQLPIPPPFHKWFLWILRGNNRSSGKWEYDRLTGSISFRPECVDKEGRAGVGGEGVGIISYLG